MLARALLCLLAGQLTRGVGQLLVKEGLMRKHLSLPPITVCFLLLLFTAGQTRPCGQGSGAGSTIVNVPTLGGSGFQVNALNSGGDITGYSYTPGDLAAHAFLFSGGTVHDLGTLGGDNSQSSALNTSGQIVGDSAVSDNAATHGFLYSAGTMIDLGTLGGSYSSAIAINDAGQIAGNSLLE